MRSPYFLQSSRRDYPEKKDFQTCCKEIVSIVLTVWTETDHRGIGVGARGLQPVVHHVVVGVGHPGPVAPVGAVGFGAVHQVLLAQGDELTPFLGYLALDGSGGAEGPTGTAETLRRRSETCDFSKSVLDRSLLF